MKLSLRVVVIGGVIAGLLVPMSIGTFVASTRLQDRLMADAKGAHGRVTDVLALGVQKALWDLAPEGAAPLVKSVLDDPRIVKATVLDGQGAVFHEEADESRRIGTVLTLEKPVLNENSEIGKVRVEFSLAKAEEDIASRMFETLLISAMQALVCISILVVLLNRRVLARVELLKRQARLLASKSLDQPFEWQETDEIGELGVCLESTRVSLKDLFTNLESIVAERTATIKMILDHVRAGFLLVGRDQAIEGGYTRSCETLMNNKGLAGRKLAEALHLEGDAVAHFEACVEQVFEDIFPEEVSLEQIPPRARVGDRTLSIEGSTVRKADGTIATILFTVVDVTLLEQTEKENRSNRAMVKILQNIASFRDFVAESKGRLDAAKAAHKRADEAAVRRELHTLKGNSSAFGLEDLASMVHTIEDEVEIAKEHLTRVETAFQDFLEQRYELLHVRFGEEEQPGFVVSNDQLQLLAKSVGGGSTDVATSVRNWSDEVRKLPLANLLGPIGSYVETLATQRGKQVKLVLEGGATRVNSTLVKPVLQNLVHLVRNSLDHGIEPSEDRGDKDPTAQIQLRFVEVNGTLHVTIKDDGRGIDVKRVVAKATERGIITAEKAARLSRDESLALIFADGLSTAESISDTSGRGVGMSAVKEAIDSLGGQIRIKSEQGIGTEFTIEVPLTLPTSTQRKVA